MSLRRASGFVVGNGFRSVYKCLNLRKCSSRSNKSDEAGNGSYWSRYWSVWKASPLPIGVGLSVIAFLQFNKIRKRDVKAVEGNEEYLDVDKYGDGVEVLKPWQMSAYQNMPLNALSRVVGKVFNGLELPVWSRKHVIGMYAAAFGCDLGEAESSSPEDYPTLGAFFRRRLRADLRPISPSPLTSPCDGRVLACGPVDAATGTLEQIKGVAYPVDEFLGTPGGRSGNYYQVTMYLAPGDYHCFHSPADWSAQERRHFRGKLLSVSPFVVGKVPNLFSINERVVYTGRWMQDKFFSFVAVGATNVGSIVVPCDRALKTNQKKCNSGCEVTPFDEKLTKGDYFGEFNFGSTIVLVFEMPTDKFELGVVNGQKVRVGQALIKEKEQTEKVPLNPAPFCMGQKSEKWFIPGYAQSAGIDNTRVK